MVMDSSSSSVSSYQPLFRSRSTPRVNFIYHPGLSGGNGGCSEELYRSKAWEIKCGCGTDGGLCGRCRDWGDISAHGNVIAERNAISRNEQVDGPKFECNICFDMAREPVATLCGHLFCWPCLYLWLSSPTISVNPICPTCKSPCSSEDDIVPIYTRANARSSPTPDAEGRVTLYLDEQQPRLESEEGTMSTMLKRKSGKQLPLADLLLLPHLKQPTKISGKTSKLTNEIPPRPLAKRLRSRHDRIIQETGMQAVFVALYAGWAGLSIFTGSGSEVALQRMILMLCMFGCLVWYIVYN